MRVRTEAKAADGFVNFPEGITMVPRRVTMTFTEEPAAQPEEPARGQPYDEEARVLAAQGYGRGGWPPWDVEMEATLQGDAYECTSLTLRARPGSVPVTSTWLRDISIRQLLRDGLLDWFFPHGVEARIPRETTGGRATDETYRAVATIYRVSKLLQDPPVEAVASFFQRPRPTAARWVQEARRRGFLKEVS